MTATPPDLPLGWSREEIEYIQDRHAIECVHIMRKYMDEMFSYIYRKIKDLDSLACFFPTENIHENGKTILEQHREFFIESYTSVSTRYI